MPDNLDGFPFWVLEFNKDATPVDAAAVQRFPSELKSEGISDVFFFSHGWNNDHAAAKSLYQRFFAEVAKLFQDASVPKKIPGAKIGVTGVLWPSILWPDDAPTDGPQPELPRPAGGGSVAINYVPRPQNGEFGPAIWFEDGIATSKTPINGVFVSYFYPGWKPSWFASQV